MTTSHINRTHFSAPRNHAAILRESAATTTGTNTITYVPDTVQNPLGYENWFYKGGLFIVNKTANSANDVTLDAKLQYYDPGAAAWDDYLDYGGNAVAFVQWVNDSNVRKTIYLYPGPVGVDVDGMLVYAAATGNKRYDLFLPAQFRWKFTETGTTASTTWSMSAHFFT